MSELEHPGAAEPDPGAGAAGAAPGASSPGGASGEEAAVPRAAAPRHPGPSDGRRRPGPLTVMGPWAPVAGALLGLVAAIVAVLLLRGSAHGFGQRLSLVLLLVGLSMLGADGPLLADEVRVLRRGVREAAQHPGWAQAARGLFSGLTPARLLLLVSAFVLFLSAYLGRG